MQRVAFAFVASLSFSALAAPQAPTSPAAAQNAGVRAFEEGRFQDAVERFSEAYRAKAQPLLLLSIAKARYRLRQLDEAKQCLFDFLRDDPNGVAGSEAFDLLTRIEQERPTAPLEKAVACVAQASPAKPPVAAAPPPPKDGALSKAPAETSSALAAKDTGAAKDGVVPSPWVKNPAAPASTAGAGADARPAVWATGSKTSFPPAGGDKQRGYWSYSMIGASAVAAGAGVFFGLKNASATSDWRAARTPDASAAARDRARSAAQSANIAWVASGALAAGGLGLLFFTRF